MPIKEMLKGSVENKVCNSQADKNLYSFVVKDKNGLHGRPATGITKAVGKYVGEVIMVYNKEGREIKVDPRSILLLLSECIRYGTKISFHFKDGDPAQEILGLIEMEVTRQYEKRGS